KKVVCKGNFRKQLANIGIKIIPEEEVQKLKTSFVKRAKDTEVRHELLYLAVTLAIGIMCGLLIFNHPKGWLGRVLGGIASVGLLLCVIHCALAYVNIRIIRFTENGWRRRNFDPDGHQHIPIPEEVVQDARYIKTMLPNVHFEIETYINDPFI